MEGHPIFSVQIIVFQSSAHASIKQIFDKILFKSVKICNSLVSPYGIILQFR